MITRDTSQAGQTRWVDAVLGGKCDGWFIDVGANHPVELSNTYALEAELGWTGILLDSDENCVKLCREQRKSVVYQGDARTFDWEAKLMHIEPRPPTIFDYLSCDCDEHTLEALSNILRNGPAFRVITTEHDGYLRGDRLRIPMRALLAEHGYLVVCSDVCSSDGLPYEEWCVSPKLVPFENYERFICHGKKWTEILPP